MAGALWATLTHARCTPALENHVLGQVHMIQHQVGAAQRVDMKRFESLVDENASLARALNEAQRRNAMLTEEHARRQEALQGQIVQLRADLIGRDTAVATMKESLQALESAMPGLKTRHELAAQGERQIERIHELELALAQAQQDAQVQRRRAQVMADKLHPADEAWSLCPSSRRKPMWPSKRAWMTEPSCAWAAGRPACRSIAS
jgi:DNA repair exonuclease SbcCD ATPase subunit